MKSCFIYKALKGDEVLYVGIADKLSRRFSQHKSYSEWYDLQDTIKVSELPNRRVCKLYETYLIKTLTPKFNKSENNGDDFSLVSFDETNIRWEEYRETLEETHVKPLINKQERSCDTMNENFLSNLRRGKKFITSYKTTEGCFSINFSFPNKQLAKDFREQVGFNFRTETHHLISSSVFSGSCLQFSFINSGFGDDALDERYWVKRLYEI